MDWVKYAKSELISIYKRREIGRIVVGYITNSSREDELFKLSYIGICEHKIKDDTDFGKWQERLYILPHDKIYYLKSDGEPRNIKDVIDDVCRSNKLTIHVCVKIISEINENEYIVKLFDRYYIYKPEKFRSFLDYKVNRVKRYLWIVVHHVEGDNYFVERLKPVSNEFAFAVIL